MSATIILIMTSSSTRKTEPPGGRVVVMMMSLPVPDPRIANNVERRNVNVLNTSPASLRLGPEASPIAQPITPRYQRGFRLGNRHCVRIFGRAGAPLRVRVPEQQLLLRDR